MTSFAKSMLLATTLTLGLAGAAAAQEAENPLPPMEHWAFSGPFGTYDTAQLQRGYQVYRQVCSNCHAAKFLSFRNLAEAGGPQFSDSQVKALAATFKVQDGPDDSGNMYDRPGRPSDPFRRPSPTSRRRAPPTAAPIRPTCRRWPRRGPSSAAGCGSCWNPSANTRTRGRTTSTPCSTATRTTRRPA